MKIRFLNSPTKTICADHQVTEMLTPVDINQGRIDCTRCWGAIEYKGTGYFIAGGAGINSFLSIMRYRNKENKLAGNKLLSSTKQPILEKRAY
jgi:hypothetical protein